MLEEWLRLKGEQKNCIKNSEQLHAALFAYHSRLNNNKKRNNMELDHWETPNFCFDHSRLNDNKKRNNMELDFHEEWNNMDEPLVSQEMYVYIKCGVGEVEVEVSPFYIFQSTSKLYIWNLYFGKKLDKTLENNLLKRNLRLKY